MQEEIIVETLLDTGVAGLVMSSEFTRKMEFKIEKSIYVQNIDNSFNKKGPIKYMMKMNIY